MQIWPLQNLAAFFTSWGPKNKEGMMVCLPLLLAVPSWKVTSLGELLVPALVQLGVTQQTAPCGSPAFTWHLLRAENTLFGILAEFQ